MKILQQFLNKTNSNIVELETKTTVIWACFEWGKASETDQEDHVSMASQQRPLPGSTRSA